MIGGEYKSCWPKREPRGAWRLCEPRTAVKQYDNLAKSKSCRMIFRKEKVKDSPTIIFLLIFDF